jgi:hypothetical protein
LASVSIPSTIREIGVSAFYECKAIEQVNITDLAAWCNISFNGELSNPLYYTQRLLVNGKEITDLEIPNTVKSIGAYAFDGLSALKSVTIANSVTKICEYAFNSCENLKTASIPNSVLSIGRAAFYGCTSLTSMVIPNSVTIIGMEAFQGCSSLETVDIPTSVTEMGDSSFHGCTSLQSVVIPKSLTYISGDAFAGCTSLNHVTIPNSVTYIDYMAFIGCTSLTNVDIPSSVTSIDYSAFRETGLTSLTIHNTLTSLGQFAFMECLDLKSLIIEDGENELQHFKAFEYDKPKEAYFGRQMDFSMISCDSLETVEFGENVKSIVSGAFKDGSKIRTVKVYNSVPPETDDTFSSKTYIDGVLYVPDGSEDAYAAAPGWKDFWEIKTMQITTAISDVCDGTQYSVSDGVLHIVGDAPVRVVAINGAVIYSGKGDNDINLNKGMYIVVIGDKASKIVVR